MNTSDLHTERLRLVTITTEMMDADAARSERLGDLLSAELPDLWPPEHWEPHVFSYMKNQILEHPATLGWNRYIVVKAPAPTLIGTVCGFPRGPSGAEIGYTLLGPWQHLGLATESVRAYTTALFAHGSVQSITAETFPGLTGSLGVLRRCGFRCIGPGSEEGAVRFGLERPRELVPGD